MVIPFIWYFSLCLTCCSVPGVLMILKTIKIGIMRVEERVNHQPRAYPHHGYSMVLLNLRGVYLINEKRKVP